MPKRVPNKGIVVVCPNCGLTYVTLWVGPDDIFECPYCLAEISIGN